MRKLLFSFTKKDFRVTFYRASGPGGQNVNKRSTACRIFHIESGLSSACQEFRTQFQNKKEAFRKLANLLVDYYIPKNENERTPSDKVVRTYNESKNYVKDHETGEMFSYKETVGKKDISSIIENKILKTIKR